MQNEIVKTEQNPAEMLRYAIDKGATIDQIERLLVMKERFEANEARKAYHVAMAAFKADPPKIKKDKKVGFQSGTSKVGYSHASLGNVTELVNAGLSKHGLSASWGVVQTGGAVSVTTRITHKLGHSEETTLTAPADTSGAKNAIQAIGSTISYLERYGLLALTGLATYDIDDDGQTGGTQYITEKELHQLRDHYANEGLSEEQVCAYLKVESLDKLPQSDLQKALRVKRTVKK